MISYVMNILIVDDSPIYRAMLKQAFQGHIQSCNISEAEDGLEAVEICKKQSFDLIFMDVVMPNISGMEATKLIRELDPFVMIIAVSAQENLSTLQGMLKAGAVDYIRKPFEETLIEKRVYNYLSLANYRRFTSGNYASISLFNEVVFKRTILFHIKNEDDLSEFWEFFLTHYDINKNRSFSKDFFEAIKLGFDIIEVLIQQSKQATVVYESNDIFSYLTIGSIRSINQTLLKEIIEHKKAHTSADIEIAFSWLKLSLKFKKYQDQALEMRTDTIVLPVVEPKVAFRVEDAPKEPIAPSAPAKTNEQVKLMVVDFFDPDEMSDINEAMLDLETRLNILQYSQILPNEALEIADSLIRIARILGSYNEFADVGVAFKSLALDIQENIDSFIKNSSKITHLFMGLLDNLKVWECKLFSEGVERFDFLNDTFIADSQQISIVFCERSIESDGGMDDIFF